MSATPISNEHMHCVFVYCNQHDQGAVAVITDNELLDTIASSETKYYNYDKIFKYVITMCGSDTPTCIDMWRLCGDIEYIPQNELLIGKESVQTNFIRECGGWEFKYFNRELYTSQGNIELQQLPSAVSEYLTHLDNSG